MDLRMPGTDGVEATTAHRQQRSPATAVLIITTYDTDNDIIRAVEAGAKGYLLKDTPRSELVRAVRAAAVGGTGAGAGRWRPNCSGRSRASPAAPELTGREVEVLALVAAGKTNAEIGQVLFIGEATVKTDLLHAFAKLGVDDRTAAVTTAIARGWLPAP